MRGKGLNMIHCYLDNLWAQGDKSIEPPLISGPCEEKSEIRENKEKVEYSETGDDENILEEKLDNLTTEESSKLTSSEESKEISEASVDHEEILTNSFLAACKFKSKEIKFPIVVSTFMKTMQSCW